MTLMYTCNKTHTQNVQWFRSPVCVNSGVAGLLDSKVLTSPVRGSLGMLPENSL